MIIAHADSRPWRLGLSMLLLAIWLPASPVTATTTDPLQGFQGIP